MAVNEQQVCESQLRTREVMKRHEKQNTVSRNAALRHLLETTTPTTQTNLIHTALTAPSTPFTIE